jgi:hypothetical protein
MLFGSPPPAIVRIMYVWPGALQTRSAYQNSLPCWRPATRLHVAFRQLMYTLMYTNHMKDLSVTEFRRQCLTLLEDLPEEGLLITKRGRPLARITPVSTVGKGARVVLPLLQGTGQRGPLCPNTETPYDLVFD